MKKLIIAVLFTLSAAVAWLNTAAAVSSPIAVQPATNTAQATAATNALQPAASQLQSTVGGGYLQSASTL